MNKNSIKNAQEEQLKKLKDKPLPEHIEKSVDQKLKNINKPINK